MFSEKPLPLCPTYCSVDASARDGSTDKVKSLPSRAGGIVGGGGGEGGSVGAVVGRTTAKG